MNFKLQALEIRIESGTAIINNSEGLFINLLQEFLKKGLNAMILNASLVLDEETVLFAFEQAFKAIQEKSNISNSLGKELVLRVFSQRQTSKSFELNSFENNKKNEQEIILVVWGEKINSQLADQLKKELSFKPKHLELNKEKKTKLIKLHGIDEKMLEKFSLKDLVIESIAMNTISLNK